MTTAASVCSARRPVTHYWRASFEQLSGGAEQFNCPRATHPLERALRTADSLWLIALSSAPQRDSRGRFQWQYDRGDTTRDTVMVLFRDRAATEFARQVSPLLDTSSAESRKAQRDWAARMRNRVHFLDGRERKLEHTYHANVFEKFQYAAAVVIDIPHNMLARLFRRTDVANIQTLKGSDASSFGPCSAPGETAPAASAVMGIERFRGGGLGVGRIALLDTGVRSSHQVFTGSGQIDGWLDCTGTLQGCVESSSQEDVDFKGHGTSTAAILVGGQMGSERTGITDARLTSYKIYGSSGSSYGLIRDGAARAMEDAIRRGFDVIVAEVADIGDAKNVMGRLASEAFDLGAIVVAATGNDSLRPLPSPAISSRAIGVGGYCVHNGQYVMSYTHGRTADGRVKPDIGAPTGVLTVGNSSGGQTQSVAFNGTSGATPFAAAAALSLKNWMSRAGSSPVNPGMVYAMLVACGTEARVDNRSGAGLVVLPPEGTAWWGKAVIGSRETIEIPLDPGYGADRIEAALWWPEYGRNGALPERLERAAIALQLTSPDGRAVLSADPGSVFQRASVQGDPNLSGSWRLTIQGIALRRGAREVYWAAWAKPTSPPIP